MSANSYPSPISSASSPRLHGSPAPTGPPPPARAHRIRQNTQRSLQSAAADLEVAFARLEQVRASLMQLSNRIGEPAAQSRAREQVGPSHDAIMLTGGQGEEAWAQGNPTGEETDLLFATYENSFRRAVQAHNSLALFAEQNPAVRRAISPELPAQARLPHQPLPFNEHDLRYVDPRDDGFTAVGRNVIAREVAARRQAPTTGDNNVRTTSASQLTRESTMDESTPALQRLGDPTESRRLGQIQNQLSSPATSPLLWRQEPRRRRPYRTDTRPPSTRTSGSGQTSTVSSEPSGLSMLSSFSIQNFSAPVSAAPSITRPLLFEEPESYTDSVAPPGQYPANVDVIMLEDVPFGRNYIIRRHVNAEGRERVQNINLDFMDTNANSPGWREESNDASLDHLRRRTMMQNFQDRAQRPSSAMNPGGTHTPNPARRRGWARLDPDGNEIPSDEEEELERYRTEYRIRATNRARANVVLQPAASVALDARLVMYGSVMDSVANVSDAHRRARLRREPEVEVERGGDDDYILRTCNPLPMPLEGMVERGGYRDLENESVLMIDSTASFAGR